MKQTTKSKDEKYQRVKLRPDTRPLVVLPNGYALGRFMGFAPAKSQVKDK